MARCGKKTKEDSGASISGQSKDAGAPEQIHNDIAQVLVEQQSNIVNEMKTGAEIRHDPDRKGKAH